MPSARYKRLPPETVEIVILQGEGHIVTRRHKYVYECLGCHQVWPLLHLAETCVMHGHVSSQVQDYRRPHATAWSLVVSHTYHALRRVMPD